MEPGLETIVQAAERIKPYAHRTPVIRCSGLDRLSGAELYFKCENFQKVGAFKFRGAMNAVLSLSESEAQNGVAAHSSGNHAAALALAARLRGIRSYIVMPENAPLSKKNAVASYGAEIRFCEPTLAARERELEALIEQSGATLIHPYNDYRIIAGQATTARELLEEVPGLDLVMAPVGGGGLLSGTALSVSALRPGAAVIGAEPEKADDALQSLRAGRIIPSQNPDTIADGLLTSLGDKTFAIIHRHVRDIHTVPESEIIEAMRLIWERAKIIIEPSSAVPFAAVLSRPEFYRGRKVGIILTGGNLDLDKLPW